MPMPPVPVAWIVPELLTPPEKVEIVTCLTADVVPATTMPDAPRPAATILPVLRMPPPKVEIVTEP